MRLMLVVARHHAHRSTSLDLAVAKFQYVPGVGRPATWSAVAGPSM